MLFGQDVTPLVPASWGQTSPYNDACPTVDGTPTAPGCVALAIAHAMSVYRYPTVPQGSVAYTTSTHNLPVSADFSASSIPWDAILTGDNSAIASFIYLCAAASYMDFCPSTSTTPAAYELSSLATHFGYDTDMSFRSRDCYSHDAWHEMIRKELGEGRPVIMNATDRSYGAHAFVIDGCKTASEDSSGSSSAISNADSPACQTLYHIVWGWGGKDDGYYDIDNLQTPSYTFNDNIRVLTGIMPDDKKRATECSVEGIFALNDTVVDAGQPLTLRYNIYNRGYYDYSCSYNIYLTSPDGTETQIGRKQYAYDIRTGYSGQAILSFTAPNEPGEYRLRATTKPLISFNTYPVPSSGHVMFRVADNGTSLTPPVTACDGNVSEPLYNLSGQRVTSSYRGIVIRGKRKTMR